MTFKQTVLVWYYTKGCALLRWIVPRLPKLVVFQCVCYAISQTTTGPYAKRYSLDKVPAKTVAQVFGRIHGIPGNGKDDLFDSNARFYTRRR